MEVNFMAQTLNVVKAEVPKFVENFQKSSSSENMLPYERLGRILNVFTPILTVVIFYRYVKYLIVLNACQYEESVKKRCDFLKKLSKQLKFLAKRCESLYFCYMPMSHGTTLPRSYSLFMAIKEVLANANKPTTQMMRRNLLIDLIYEYQNRGSRSLKSKDLKDADPDILNGVTDEFDPLGEFNLDIMQCSRDLIIQGVKDFEVMSTVYRVMETVMSEITD